MLTLCCGTGAGAWLRDRKLSAGEPAIGLEMALAGGLDHAVGQSRRGGVVVPAAGAAFGVLRLVSSSGVRPPADWEGGVLTDSPRTVPRVTMGSARTITIQGV